MARDIKYSDGNSSESKVLSLLRGATNLESHAIPGHDHYGEWAVEYHLCPERSHLLRPFDFSGLNVLELGAGMGAVSRLLAEKAARVTFVEGTSQRHEALCERLRDLENWDSWVGNLHDFSTEIRYDVVCVIGVLEYSELFISGTPGTDKTPFDLFLQKVRSFLKPSGVLVLAIENRLGLKYWAGIGEDHLGTPYDGIVGYPASKSPKTFSRLELASLLNDAGFLSRREYFPYPDYKIPSSVLSSSFLSRFPKEAAAVASSSTSRDYLNPSNSQRFPERLANESLASTGQMAEFSNSFLVLASEDPNSPILQKLCATELEGGALGWHFNSRRKLPTVTTFRESNGALLVDKEPLLSNATPVEGPFWHGASGSHVLPPPHWLTLWTREVYFGRNEQAMNLLERFMRWSLDHWRVDGQLGLAPAALDALIINTAVDGQGNPIGHFDLEWESRESLRESYFIFRNCSVLWNQRPFLASFYKGKTLTRLHADLCERMGVKNTFERDLLDEAHFQAAVHTVSDASFHARAIHNAFSHEFRREEFPRKAGPVPFALRLRKKAKRILRSRFPRVTEFLKQRLRPAPIG